MRANTMTTANRKPAANKKTTPNRKPAVPKKTNSEPKTAPTADASKLVENLFLAARAASHGTLCATELVKVAQSNPEAVLKPLNEAADDLMVDEGHVKAVYTAIRKANQRYKEVLKIGSPFFSIGKTKNEGFILSMLIVKEKAKKPDSSLTIGAKFSPDKLKKSTFDLKLVEAGARRALIAALQASLK